MKRMFAVLLALVMAVSFCACGSRASGEDPTEATPPSLSTQPEEPSEEATTPTEATFPELPTEPSLPPVTEPTLLPVPTEPEPIAPTQPSAPPSPVLPPVTEATICGHVYQLITSYAPSCTEAGYENYLCSKCGVPDQQLLFPLGHCFREADCLNGQVCDRCGIAQGAPLGHQYTEGSCTRCGEIDPSVRHITITVKDNKNAPVPGVTVELYTTQDLPAGTCISDADGKLRFTLWDHPGKYTLVLAQIPQGYKARQNRYEYGSDSGAIVLELVPVIHPEDHSRADYRVGDTMGDFTLTDVDGNVYSLSGLLETKKLVILNFWYCSCIPCKAEFPYFNSVYQRYGNDLELLALNHMDSEDQIRKLRDEMGLCFPLLREQIGMKEGFGIRSYPMTVFIGENGRILRIQKDAPFESEEALDALIRQLLGL